MKTGHTIRLIARILALAAIAFISLFALDAFGPGKSLWTQIGDFIMHLIPSFVLLIIFIIALKRELIGGILYVAVALLNAPWIYKHNFAMNQSVGMSIGIVCMLLAPFLITGLLFIICHYKYKVKE